MKEQELKDLLSRYLTKNDYDDAVELLREIIDEVVSETRSACDYSR